MNITEAVGIIDGFIETDDEASEALALQVAVNGGLAWRLQGSFGRSAMAAIKDGYIMLGREPSQDYYGNRIPSRFEVQAGTLGSYEFVADRMGVEWAEFLAEAE